jgi:LmbE family N-acetylglucosaminyl deacetylase
MKTCFGLVLLLLVVAGIRAAEHESSGPPAHTDPNIAPIDLDRGAPGLARCLAQLRTRASILMITAHPDDEDGGLLAYQTRGLGARAALMSLTRGEGGQNAMSNDMYDALGLLRTQELLAAGRYYGVDQYFGSVIDYGFSKTREEALEKWGHDRVLGEVVRVVRTVRPLILISVFAGAPTDGHGNHQVSGQVAQEAFLAAGDPTRFPEQIREGLRPWSPQKVYAHVPFFQPTKEGIYDYATDKYVPARFFDYVHQRWMEEKPSMDIGVSEGQPNPPSGLTYLQIGREGLAFQRTQNHGGMIPPPAAFKSEYHRYGERVATTSPEHSLYDGIDSSIAGIADLASGDIAFMRPGLQAIADRAEEASALYKVDHAAAIAPALSNGLKATRALLGEVEKSTLAEPGKSDVEFELRVKEQQFERSLSLALGIYFEASVASDRPPDPSPFAGAQPTFTVAIPGQAFSVQTRVVNTGTEDLELGQISVASPLGGDWSIEADSTAPKQVPGEQDVRVKFKVRVPADAMFTRPYFSRPDEEQPYYNIEDPRWQTLSTAPYPLEATMRVLYQGEQITMRAAVQALHREELIGMEADPLIVAPAISVAVEPRAGAVPLHAHSFGFTCILHSNVKGPANGIVHLRLPEGWTATPAEYSFAMPHDGDTQTVTFEVVPRNIQSKAYEIKAVADYQGKTFEEGYRMAGYPGLRAYPYYRPASYKAVGIDVTVAPGLRVAFVPGTGDDVVRALQNLGVPVQILSAGTIQATHLANFDAIILGVRAYAVRPELRAANDKLLEYVKNGGTLIVQYNLQNFDSASGPYKFELGPNPAKVVDETSAVKLLDPQSPLFRWPNAITERDFSGWQEEFGHGFLKSWDSHYQSLVETHDPDQDQQGGGLLLAHYGKGLYIYDAFALYRQLPSGVPGAYRILANLVSAGKNPQWK